MEKVFKVKGFNLWAQISLTLFILLCLVIAWIYKSPYLVLSILYPVYSFINQNTARYIVKENGDLWVKDFLGFTQHKAIGIYRVLYDRNAKGWNWRQRQMIISYESGLRRGSFPVLPEDPEGLMAVLEERNPNIDMRYFTMPVNK